jgi:[ribosomal protein S5]-alanine N-acetyltransferase
MDIPALRGPLASGRLSVRPFTSADITATYLGWLNDPEVMRYSNQRFHTHTAKSCRDYLASFSGSANHFLAICDRGTGGMLGTMTVYRSVPHGTADIGILVGDRRIWGQGIGAEAFCTVMSALEDSGLIRKITAGTLSVNWGMVRIMVKAGMQHEATRYAQELVDGAPVDIVYYAKFCHN